ncbi:MAG: reverse transcriptase domain-containing protein [Micavibrio sp.]
MKKKQDFYKQLRSAPNYLMPAWWQVYDNGLTSKSAEINDEVKQAKKEITKVLSKIQRELREDRFIFDHSKGILIKAPGKKKPRPIVIPSLRSRIVQRAILDVLQGAPQIQKYLAFPFSFGGVRRPEGYQESKLRGVPEAIEAAARAIKNGSNYYIRSDIKSFFSNISQEKVLQILQRDLKDQKFIELIRNALMVQLKNEDDLREVLNLFPSKEKGVAQGSCLSPLMGNILLYEFDQMMNTDAVVCIRYIDDLLILAKNKTLAEKAFNKGRKHLKELGLDLHEKFDDADKAAKGNVASGIDFLGVRLHSGSIFPSKKARSKIKNEIKELFQESRLKNFRSSSLADSRDYTLVNTLKLAHNKLKGWGNQYSFCNNKNAFKDMDDALTEEIAEYFNSYYAQLRSLNEQEKRKILGVHLLIDSKYDPILWEEL